jgi:hypothetical protein
MTSSENNDNFLNPNKVLLLTDLDTTQYAILLEDLSKIAELLNIRIHNIYAHTYFLNTFLGKQSDLLVDTASVLLDIDLQEDL